MSVHNRRSAEVNLISMSDTLYLPLTGEGVGPVGVGECTCSRLRNDFLKNFGWWLEGDVQLPPSLHEIRLIFANVQDGTLATDTPHRAN